MIKNVFSNLSRGFFYFIGKVLAIIFVGFVVYTLISKFPVDSVDLKEIIQGVM